MLTDDSSIVKIREAIASASLEMRTAFTPITEQLQVSLQDQAWSEGALFQDQMRRELQFCSPFKEQLSGLREVLSQMRVEIQSIKTVAVQVVGVLAPFPEQLNRDLGDLTKLEMDPVVPDLFEILYGECSDDEKIAAGRRVAQRLIDAGLYYQKGTGKALYYLAELHKRSRELVLEELILASLFDVDRESFDHLTTFAEGVDKARENVNRSLANDLHGPGWRYRMPGRSPYVETNFDDSELDQDDLANKEALNQVEARLYLGQLITSAGLTERELAIFTARQVDDESFVDISAIFNIESSTARAFDFRARKKIRKIIR